MQFFQIIRSIEELLYEAVTWLLFYPITLWRCIVRPQELMRYTTEELRESPETRFTESVSPPLFLMLSVLLAHLLELSLGVRVEESEGTGALSRVIAGSEQNLLLFRSFIFAMFPLVMATGVVRRKGLPLDRDTLKGPFYRQCYFAGPYCLLVSIGGVLLRHPAFNYQVAGSLIWVGAAIWYLQVETRWFHKELGLGWGRALALALRLFLIAGLLTSLAGVIVLRA